MIITSCLLLDMKLCMMLFFPGSKLSYQPELFFSCTNDHPHFVSKIIYYCFKILHETQPHYRVFSSNNMLNVVGLYQSSYFKV